MTLPLPTKLDISAYSSLLERKLFLSTPPLAPPDIPDYILDNANNTNNIDNTDNDNNENSAAIDLQKDLLRLKYLVLLGLRQQKAQNPSFKTTYTSASALAKAMLLSPRISHPPSIIYTLWEIRLSLLAFTNDPYCTSIAKQEAKKLSAQLFKLTHLLHGDNRKIGFPVDLPLSLELLVIRLRTNSPSLLCTSELYSLLWILRGRASKDITNKGLVESSTVVLYLLSLNVSANLIAKRDYLTFLTHADSFLKNLKLKFASNANGEDAAAAAAAYNSGFKVVDIRFYSHYCLLAALITLIMGDYAKSEHYVNKLKLVNNICIRKDGDKDEKVNRDEDDANSNNIGKTESVKCLQKVLTQITPILDNEDVLRLKPLSEPPKIEKWEDLLSLNQQTRITGRIICCFCAQVELETRTEDKYVDVFRSNKKWTTIERTAQYTERKENEAVKEAVKDGEIDNANDNGEKKDGSNETSEETNQQEDENVVQIVQNKSIEVEDLLAEGWKMSINKVYGFE